MRSSLVCYKNLTTNCQLFLNQAAGRSETRIWVRYLFKRVVLKYFILSSSTLSSTMARNPQVSSSIFVYLPQFYRRQVRQLVICSFVFLEIAFSFLMMSFIKEAISLLRSAKHQNSPNTLFSIALISPIQKAASFSSPLLYLTSLPISFELSFQKSSNLPITFSKSFYYFFSSVRYLTSSLTTYPWIRSNVLYMDFTRARLSFKALDIERRIRSILLLHVGSSCGGLGFLGSLYQVGGWNFSSSARVPFSVFQNTIACSYFSSAAICPISLSLLREISGAASSRLMRDCWSGTMSLKRSYFLVCHSRRSWMACLVFSAWADFIIDALDDIVI